jgi:hypothetical protein
MSRYEGLERANYYGDRRVAESMRVRAYEVVDVDRNMRARLKLHESLVESIEEEASEPVEDYLRACSIRVENDDEHGLLVVVRSDFQVCPLCSGRGAVVDPNIDAGGLTREDFDHDPQFESDYFGGVFDMTCPTCDGLRVVPEPDLPNALLAQVRAFEDDADSFLSEQLAELRFGC